MRSERLRGSLVVALLALVGAVVGIAAQLLREHEDSRISALGAATAVYVTVGFFVTRFALARLHSRKRWLWGSAAMAAYLLAWLAAYHLLFAAHYDLGWDAAWIDARAWVAAVPLASLALGFIAARSLRLDVVGFACLALPLLWSMPDLVDAAGKGSSYLAVVGGPTIFAAFACLALGAAFSTRRRTRTAEGFGALAEVARGQLQRDSES